MHLIRKPVSFDLEGIAANHCQPKYAGSKITNKINECEIVVFNGHEYMGNFIAQNDKKDTTYLNKPYN